MCFSVPCVLLFYTNELTRNVMTELNDDSSGIVGHGIFYLERIDAQFSYILAQYDVFSGVVTSQLTGMAKFVFRATSVAENKR